MQKYDVSELSSLNLRGGRGKDSRLLSDPIQCSCDVCKTKYKVGKTGDVLVRIKYILHNEQIEKRLCDKCVDIFADLCRYGPRVISSASSWMLRSRVVRMLAVKDHLFCFNCQSKADSHIFVKYDDMHGTAGNYGSRRVCARCAVSYLELMQGNSVILKKEEFPYFEESLDTMEYVREL